MRNFLLSFFLNFIAQFLRVATIFLFAKAFQANRAAKITCTLRGNNCRLYSDIYQRTYLSSSLRHVVICFINRHWLTQTDWRVRGYLHGCLINSPQSITSRSLILSSVLMINFLRYLHLWSSNLRMGINVAIYQREAVNSALVRMAMTSYLNFGYR